MTLPHPILDDRSYAELRDELVARIPVYNPEWTDHNPADPGITLIELFAFLGESALYRFNQIPEATKLEFLELLQIPMRSAAPARALVAASIDDLSFPLVEIGSEAKAGKVLFETEHEVSVLPVAIAGVSKQSTPVPSSSSDESARYQEILTELGLQEEDAASYENALISSDGSGDSVDLAKSVDGVLWIAVLDELGDREGTLAALKDSTRVLSLGFLGDLEAPSRTAVEACPGTTPAANSPALEWEISTGRLTDGDAARPEYLRLEVVSDTTAGLQSDGIVRLELPSGDVDLGTFTAELSVPEAAGTGALPPELDEETAEKILFWIRSFRVDGQALGKIQLVVANATFVVQQRSASAENLGLGTGQPSQTFSLVHSSVVPETLKFAVEETDGWVPWTRVDGFHASGESDRHFMLDAATGTITTGDGTNGAVPALGRRARANEYAFCEGSAGNVAAGSIAKLTDFPRVALAQPLAASGGRDTESVATALSRIPGELRRRDRAVTQDDFRELALEVSGVGRSECLARYYPLPTASQRTADGAIANDANGVPTMGLTEVPGVVTVMILPTEDAESPDAPMPGRLLLEAVCKYLDERRLVTTELYVIPPRYRRIAVSVGLKVKSGYGVEAVRRWVELVIRQYLAPLPPYGPSGEGWPLGRRIHGPELEAAALQVEGVEYLEGDGIAVGALDDQGALVPSSGRTVLLAIDQLPELAAITVVSGTPLDLAETITAPVVSTTSVPIPVVREEC